MSEELLPTAGVKQRYRKSDSALYRWERDPNLNFPKAAFVIAKRKYWRISELEAWEATLPSETGIAAPKPRRAA